MATPHPPSVTSQADARTRKRYGGYWRRQTLNRAIVNDGVHSGAADAVSSIGLQFLSISVRTKPTILGAVQGAQSIISDRTDCIKQLDKASTRIPPSPPDFPQYAENLRKSCSSSRVMHAFATRSFTKRARAKPVPSHTYLTIRGDTCGCGFVAARALRHSDRGRVSRETLLDDRPKWGLAGV
jgi:hypothetical protein